MDLSASRPELPLLGVSSERSPGEAWVPSAGKQPGMLKPAALSEFFWNYIQNEGSALWLTCGGGRSRWRGRVLGFRGN